MAQQPDFLKGKYWNTPEFRSAVGAAKLREVDQDITPQEGESLLDAKERLALATAQPQDIANYLDRIKRVIKEKGELFKRLSLYPRYIIEPENISDEYIKNVILGNLAEERGYDRSQLTEPQVKEKVLNIFNEQFQQAFESFSPPSELRQQVVEQSIGDQQARLDQWFDYLTSDEAENYPDAYRYWVMAEVVKLGARDPERQNFNKRDNNTAAPFPERNQQALALVLDQIQKKHNKQSSDLVLDTEEAKQAFQQMLSTENFGKLYAWALDYVKSLKVPEDSLVITDGAWRTYTTEDEAAELSHSIDQFNTAWCIAGEGTARGYLKHSDLHIYYSLDEQNQPTIPRACIVMNRERQQVPEVRGIVQKGDTKQHVDDYIEPVVSAKLKEVPGGEQWSETMADMRQLATIHIKNINREQLTCKDLLFLYEIDRPINSTGYGKDNRITEVLDGRDIIDDIQTIYGYDFGRPQKEELEFIYDVGKIRTPTAFIERAQELRKDRNTEADMLVIFECTREQIANTPDHINEATKAYVGPLEPGIFQKLQQHNIEHIFTQFPERPIRREQLEVGGKTGQEYITELEAKGVKLSQYAKDMLLHPDFVQRRNQNPETENLIRLTIADLGFTSGATTEQIYQRAEELGLTLCPPDTGPSYRLNYKDQPLDEWVRIGMETITDFSGNPSVFSVERHEGGLWLNDDWAGPDDRWGPNDEFVFRLGKSETST